MLLIYFCSDQKLLSFLDFRGSGIARSNEQTGGESGPTTNQRRLLQSESFVHQALQSRFVEDIVGKFLVGKHGEGGSLGVSNHL
jgi:hypothetical protein